MAADPKQLKLVKNLGSQGIAFGLDRVPDSDRIFYGSSDFKVYEIDLGAEKPESKALEGESVGRLPVTSSRLVRSYYEVLGPD